MVVFSYQFFSSAAGTHDPPVPHVFGDQRHQRSYKYGGAIEQKVGPSKVQFGANVRT